MKYHYIDELSEFLWKAESNGAHRDSEGHLQNCFWESKLMTDERILKYILKENLRYKRICQLFCQITQRITET